MTNKVIIDGVDVSKCEYSFKQFDNWIGKDVVSCGYTLGFRCEPKANCCKFYMDYLEKQLKRAEQKIEKIKDIVSGNYERLDPLAKQQIVKILRTKQRTMNNGICEIKQPTPRKRIL